MPFNLVFKQLQQLHFKMINLGIYGSIFFPLEKNACKDTEEVKPKYLEIQADWTAMHHGAAVMRTSSGWLLGSSPRELLEFK